MKNSLTYKLLLTALLSYHGAAFAEEHEHHHHQQKTLAATPSTDSIFNITDEWIAADGKSFQIEKFSGNPTVVAMVYTSCQYVCPLTVQNMKRIERALNAREATKVNFALFSLDPERDTPAKLTAFAKQHNITSSSWTLAQGKAGSIRKLAVTLGVKYKKIDSGDYEHDATISIIDSNGVVKYQADAMNKNIDDATEALKKLIK